MEAVPDVLAVGVKVAVYVVPEPVNVDSAPPVVEMSPATKSDADSESVNVMVSVWPDFSDPEPARVMVTVGTTPSTLWADCVATALWVSVALFAAVSLIVPEFNDRESAVIARPSVSVSPDTTV
jgi:hypothetical protein